MTTCLKRKVVKKMCIRLTQNEDGGYDVTAAPMVSEDMSGNPYVWKYFLRIQDAVECFDTLVRRYGNGKERMA